MHFLKLPLALVAASFIAAGASNADAQNASKPAPPAAKQPPAAAKPAGPAPDRITGQVFEDKNRNGARDAADGDATGVVVLLTDPAGAKEIARTMTAADGRFVFATLSPGQYRITVKLQDGFERTTDDSKVVTLARGAAAPAVVFGIARRK